VIAYLDSSVLLRVILGQKAQLTEWRTIATGVTSELAEVECLRTIDRLRALGHLTVEETSARREAVFRVVETLETVELTRAVLRRASQPMPGPLGTLDAIHLTTAEMWREAREGEELIVATHDAALALAARASGFRVLGV
jgi:predicted nucleic acid-binding protein